MIDRQRGAGWASTSRARLRQILLIWGAAAAIATSPALGQPRTVEVDPTPVWGPNPVLVEELRIGSVMGEEGNRFGFASDLAVAPDGRFWVLDGREFLVKSFAEDGAYLGAFGRAGEGPGEFKNPWGIRWFDGEVWVGDPINAKLHGFSENGEFLRQIRIDTRGIIGRPPLLHVDQEGNLSVLQSEWDNRSPTRPRYWLRTSQDGTTLPRVYVLPGNSVGRAQPIRTSTGLMADGTWVAGRNDEFRFWNDPDGSDPWVLVRDVEAVRKTRPERRNVQLMEDWVAGNYSADPLRVPVEKPIWRNILPDADGRIWVEMYKPGTRVQETDSWKERRIEIGRPAITWAQDLSYDVVHPDGTFFGSITIPNSATAYATHRYAIYHATGNTIWVHYRGEFDESYVIKYRIQPGD